MPRFKHDDSQQTLMVPVSLERQLMPGTFEFALNQIVETKLDLTIFNNKIKNDDTGRPAYDPKHLLKAVLLAYSRGILGSRKIEEACQENILFIAITGWSKPDHSTIARFIAGMEDEVVEVFQNVLLICHEMDLLGGTEFALDGTKLPSNASKEWSGRFDDLEKKKRKLGKKLRKMVRSHQNLDRQNEEGKDRREKQKEKLEKAVERIGEWLKDNKPRKGKRKREVQSNITDNDSAKMSTSHGVIQGYNAQALVDKKHQIIVYGEAMGNGQDSGHIAPVMKGAKETTQKIGLGKNYFKGKQLTADSSYHSTDNLKACEKEGLDAYIPDNQFRKRDKRYENWKDHMRDHEVKPTGYGREKFKYDPKKDAYICPNGKILTVSPMLSQFPMKIMKRYSTKVNDCKYCRKKRFCLVAGRQRQKFLMREVSNLRGNYSAAMKAKIDTEKGREEYGKRMGIVEPVFANINTQKGMDRFTLRGKAKVNIQWLLYCIVHNVEKIARYGPSPFRLAVI